MADLANGLLEDYIPVVKYSGIRSNKDMEFGTAATVILPALTTIGGSSVAALGTITSTSATAFAVGRQGTTTPVLNVNASAATVVTGITLVGAAAGAGMAITVTSSGADEALAVNAKGSGGISLNATATGAVTLGRATTITTGDLTLTSGSIIVTANAKQLSFTGTGANGGVLKNLKNAAASSLSGTNIDIEILIGATPYFFTVYPTKA